MPESNWNNITDDALSEAQSGMNGETDSILWNWFFPGQKQREQFGQQVALQQMQNQWNSESEKMARAKEAGINLNTAAAAIAGGNTSAAGSVPASPAGAALGDVAQLGQSVASGVNAFTQGKANLAAADASTAAAELDREQAANVGKLARAQIMEKVGMLADKFEQNGADSIEAAQLAITLGEGDFSTVLHILSADSKIRKYHHQMKLLDNEAKNEEKRWHQIESEIKLLAAQEGEVNANKAYLEAKKEHENILKGIDERKTQILDGQRSDPYWDQWQALHNVAERFGIDSPEYKNCLQEIKDSYYYQQKGINQAEIEDAYQKYVAQFKAQADVDAAFAEYYSAIRQNELWIKAYIETVLHNGGDITSLYDRLVSMIAASMGPDGFKFGEATDRNYRRHQKPKKGNPNKRN